MFDSYRDLFLKLSIEELDVIPSGIEFHSPGAATLSL